MAAKKKKGGKGSVYEGAGAVLREYRLRPPKRSQSEVAKRIGKGWNKARVSRHENGERPVTRAVLEKFSRALEVPLDVLEFECFRNRYRDFPEVVGHMEAIIKYFSARHEGSIAP